MDKKGMAMRWGLTGLLPLLLAGCVSLSGLGGGHAADRLITLTPETAPAATTARPGVILVTEPDSDRALSATRVLVAVDDTRLAYLADAAWSDRPARLLRALLAETLRARGAGVVVEDGELAPVGARRLSGRLLALGYDARAHAAVVRLEAVRQNADGTLSARRFEASESHIAANAGAVAPALNRVANGVARQVADWMMGKS